MTSVLLTLVISLGHDVLLHSRLILELPQILGFGPFHTYLIGPLIFLLALILVNPNSKLSKWHLLHFLPFLFQAAYRIPHIFRPTETKLEFLKTYYQNSDQTIENLSISADQLFGILTFYGHRFLYIAITIGLLLSAKSSFQDAYAPRRITYKSILGLLIVYSTAWITLKVMHFIPSIGASLRSGATMINSMALSALTIMIALGFFKYRLEEIFTSRSVRKYQSSGLDESSSRLLQAAIERVVNEKQLYTLPDLKLSDLADEMSLSTQQISQAINQTKNESFNDYINRYRLEHFKRLVESNLDQKISINELALESGFSSKATFYRVFKQQIGTTPSQFIHAKKGI